MRLGYALLAAAAGLVVGYRLDRDEWPVGVTVEDAD